MPGKLSFGAMELALNALRKLADPRTQYEEGADTYRLILPSDEVLSARLAKEIYYTQGTCRVIIPQLCAWGFVQSGTGRKNRPRWVKMTGSIQERSVVVRPARHTPPPPC